MRKSISDEYAPLTQVNNKIQKTYSKPWLTKSILTTTTNKKINTKRFLKQKTQTGEIYYINNLKSIGMLLQT